MCDVGNETDVYWVCGWDYGDCGGVYVHRSPDKNTSDLSKIWVRYHGGYPKDCRKK